MPRPFSKKEKAAIRATLMQAGLKRFARQGIRATRIDDICRDAGIAKGSFYAFFASKEDLFMVIANRRDQVHKADMRAFLGASKLAPDALLGAFFDFLMERIDTDPVLEIVRDTGELSHLARKVSPDLIAENARRDREFMHEVAALLRDRHRLPASTPETLTGLMTLMISLSVQSDLIAATADYQGMVRLLREMFIDRLLKEQPT